MTNPFGQFPEKSAQKVIEFGKKAGMAEVQFWVDAIRSLFGDPPQLEHIISVLNDKVATNLNNGTDNLSTAAAHLRAQW